MTTPEQCIALREFMPYRLSIVSEVVSRVFSHHYGARFNLTIPEWRVMAVLGEDGAQATQDVIQRTQMDRVRVSRAVVRLCDKALLDRQPHPDDQRARRLTLSPKVARSIRTSCRWPSPCRANSCSF